MKHLFLSVLIITVIMIVSCEKNNDEDLNGTALLTGNVEYGIGDCMPIIDESTRIYNNYNGDLCFIVKSELENLGDGDFEQLKANSIKTTIIDGDLNIELPVNTYLVMPTDVYLYSDYNTITLKKGIVLEKEYKFWKCTSY